MQTSKLSFLVILLLSASLTVITSCGGDDETPDPQSEETCSDGIQNQDETGVDCGGVCTACPTCTDGVQNGDETGVDCGGADCDPCITFMEHMTALIDGVDFAANLVAGNEVNDLIEFQSDQSQERQMFFSTPNTVTPGTYDLVNTAGFSADYGKLFEGDYITQSGTMVITTHDTGARQLSGTFEFTGISFDFGNPTDTVTVTMGDFSVEYN